MQDESSFCLLTTKDKAKAFKTFFEKNGLVNGRLTLISRDIIKSGRSVFLEEDLIAIPLSSHFDPAMLTFPQCLQSSKHTVVPISELPQDTFKRYKEPNAFQQLVQSVSDFLLAKLGCNDTTESMMSHLPRSWEHYHSILLFPENAFVETCWNVVLDDAELASNFFSLWGKAFKVTHIARRGRINKDDSVRRPSIQALFGPWNVDNFAEKQQHPSTFDFNSTFWTSTKQNGIIYTWAPLFTMFSAGNIVEKLRIANSTQFHQPGQVVVDLYAGIGYFTLPYLLKAGAVLVHACDWNKWSIEGLRRGLRINGIDEVEFSEVVSGNPSIKSKGKQVIVYSGDHREFVTSFENSADRVNLGLLPTSEGSWDIAVRALNPARGGWLHIHVNLKENEVVEYSNHIKESINKLIQKWKPLSTWNVSIEHVECVKSFSPKVYHYVFDTLLK